MAKLKKPKSKLFKKKHSPPYKHIGMALIPPAAFTAVPNSPPPMPLSFAKRKVIVSPIIPSILGANAVAQAVGLGALGDDLGKLRIEYKEIATGTKTPALDQEVMANVVRDDTPIKEFKSSIAEPKIEETYAVPDKAKKRGRTRAFTPPLPFEEHQYSSVSHVNATFADRERTKTRFRKKSPQRVIEAMTSSNTNSPSTTPKAHIELDGPNIGKLEMDELTATPNRRNSLNQQQSDMEERLKLHEQQMREMVFDLMQTKASNQMTKTSSNMEKSRPTYDSELVREVAGLLKEQSLGGAEGALLQQQVQELVDENEVLKDAVARLNTELARFQEKYGLDPELEDTKEFLSLIKRPTWLTDVKFLSPLFLSYDKQVDAKDDIIKRHKTQFAELAKQMEEVLDENAVLRKATEDNRTGLVVSQQKWDNVKEQNQLMVEEIQLQLEQLELMEKKAKQMHADHVDEVAKLSKQLAVVDADYQLAEKGRVKHKEELAEITDKHEKLTLESERKIAPEEYARVVGQCKSEIEENKEQHMKEMKEAMLKIKEAQKEKSDALMTSTELQAMNLQLQGEVEALNDKRKSLLREIDNLRSDLDESEERELECQLHLASAVRIAEQAATERTTFAAVAEKEQLASEEAKRRSMREQWELGKMEESLRQYKLQIASHNKDISDRLRDVEENHAGQVMQYERKIAHLRKLLVEKQQALDDMATSRRNVENELETVWQAASNENRLLIESLSKSNIHLR